MKISIRKFESKDIPKIEHFNEYAYMEIEKTDTIDSMPVSLDKNGNFVNKN